MTRTDEPFEAARTVTVSVYNGDMDKAIGILKDASETIDVVLHGIQDADLHDKDKRILREFYTAEQERIDNFLVKWKDEFTIL